VTLSNLKRRLVTIRLHGKLNGIPDGVAVKLADDMKVGVYALWGGLCRLQRHNTF